MRSASHCVCAKIPQNTPFKYIVDNKRYHEIKNMFHHKY